MTKRVNEKRFLFTTALALALLLAAAVPARAQFDEDLPRVGVGVAISDVRTIFAAGATEGSFPIPSLLIPIEVSPTFRIEPILGFARLRRERDFPGNESENEEQTVTVLRLGVGFFKRAPREGASLYYGVRVGYNRLSTDEGGEEEGENASGFFVGPTVGGSYFFSDFFSIGGDVELRYTRFSKEEDVVQDVLGTTEITTSSIGIRPSLVVRFFF